MYTLIPVFKIIVFSKFIIVNCVLFEKVNLIFFIMYTKKALQFISNCTEC